MASTVRRLMQRLLETALVGVSALIVAMRLVPPGKKILLLLRYDDYSSISPTGLEMQILKLCRQHCLPITFGVIPCVWSEDGANSAAGVPLTSEKASLLREYIEAGVLNVAVHGYSHQGLALSEFDGVDSNVQFCRLSDGKRLIEHALGTAVSLFIPPWNSYDGNTLRALERLGFSCISADANGYVDAQCTLKFLPATKQRLSELRRAVMLARLVPDSQPIVVLVFHEYDFAIDGASPGKSTPEEFSDLLSWIAAQRDVRVMSLADAVLEVHDLSPNRLATNKLCQKQSRFVPPFVCPRAVYLTPAAARVVARASRMMALFFYVLVSALAAVVSSRLCAATSVHALEFRVGWFIVGLAVLICGMKAFKGDYRGVTAMALGAGTISGSVLAMIPRSA